MSYTGKMIHDINITQWLFIAHVSCAAAGWHAGKEMAWAGGEDIRSDLILPPAVA